MADPWKSREWNSTLRFIEFSFEKFKNAFFQNLEVRRNLKGKKKKKKMEKKNIQIQKILRTFPFL